ncbi:Bcr/CflA family multidrug efflux MFS transporter [Moritella dasanensis]|uniref:Bcr/CflA family multidrug efflux MFS transporter n=1 Tax=Moritella dasanensis TaxID=428031 RepID=UPI00031506B1|nr:Bcr/CflA family multidrug efflux MFS transporter [Moritella dasanensis]
MKTYFLIPFLALLSALTPLAVDMYLPAMPNIASDFNVSIEIIQTTLSTYLLGFAIGQLFYGPLADSYGRKPVLICGLVTYLIASIGIVYGDSIEQFKWLRLLQAIGGGAASVVVSSLLRDLFSGSMFSKMMSYVVLSMTLAPLVAPLIGAQLLVWFSWPSIFVVLAILTSVCLLVSYLGIKETLPKERRVAFNLSQVFSNYWLILRNRKVLGLMLCGAFNVSGMFAFLTASPFVYIEYFGIDAQDYGYLFACNILGMMVVTWVNAKIVMRFGYQQILRAGIIISAVVSVLFWLVNANLTFGLIGLVMSTVAYISLISLIGSNVMTGVLAEFPHISGTASALAATIRFGFGAISGLVISILHDGTPLPMIMVISGCGILSFLSYFILTDRANKDS